MTNYYNDAKHGRHWSYEILIEMDKAIEEGINKDMSKEMLRIAMYERYGCNYVTINKHIKSIATRLMCANEGV